jgi:hypothetical protein
MKLAIMQPYFLPYLGYFDLLNIVDEWIVFDTPQYVRRSWINKNRILKKNGGWQYITVPVKKHAMQTPINEILVADSDWTVKLFRQLDHYRLTAPYFKEVTGFLKECLADNPQPLYQINVLLFSKIASYLGIDRPIRLFSEMNLDIPYENLDKTNWGIAISKKVHAKEYINRPGGMEFINEDEFNKNGIKLTFQTFQNMIYGTGKTHHFELGMSIIDVMMWNSPIEIKHYLDTWRTTSLES